MSRLEWVLALTLFALSIALLILVISSAFVWFGGAA